MINQLFFGHNFTSGNDYSSISHTESLRNERYGNESGDACETNGELNNIPPNEILNRPFTPQEIVEAISKLKNNKSGGSDQIINEFLKHSRHEFAPCYTRIFNLILESGHMPDDWCQSVIRPIYKNKGDPNDPNNYMGNFTAELFW